ncbi:hypothetical protein GE09DRAFT_1056028 [Coniochaeta sp. 2T2.1]|nr:hypothetical protein GE09DRAFT_1056028 [Coniochaeta sp. 2T2.1]
MPDNPRTSPSDEIDLIIPFPSPRVKTAEKASSMLQSGVADGNNLPPVNNDPPRRFQLDTMARENPFKIPPAPRHAPGFFTNRKIVPRIEEPETRQDSSHQPSTTTAEKENQPSPHHASRQSYQDPTLTVPMKEMRARPPPTLDAIVRQDKEDETGGGDGASFRRQSLAPHQKSTQMPPPQTTSTVKETEAEAEQKLDKYRQKLHERSQKIQECVETMTIQGQAMQRLEEEKQHMRDYIQKLEQQMRDNADKIPKLENECKAMKDTIDSTHKEQHAQLEQYNHFKESSHNEIEEIRKEKKREQSAREHIEQELASVRDQMNERVSQVELLRQEECRHLNEKMQILSKQLEEKAAQVGRERDMAKQLAEQLEEQRQAQSALNDMRAQTSEIFKLLNEKHGKDRPDHARLAQEETRAQLDNMTKHLGGLRDLLLPHSEAVSSLSVKQEDGVLRIVSTAETLAKTQSDSKASVDQLGKEVRTHIDDMQKYLKEREDALKQQLEQSRSKNAKLKNAIELKDQERQSLDQQLREANEASRSQEGRIQDLVQQIEELKARPDDDGAAQLQSEALATEIDILKADLASKCCKISGLEAELKTKAEGYGLEMDEFRETITRLTCQMKDAHETAKSDAENAVAEVKEQCRREIEHDKDLMEEQLQQAKDDRQLVVDQLEEARRELVAREEQGQDDSDSINALQGSLNEANTRIRRLTEDATRKATDSRARQQQDAGMIQTLRIELLASKRAIDVSKKTIEDMTADHNKQTQNLRDFLGSIRSWIDGKTETHGLDGNELRKAFEAADDDVTKWTIWLDSLLAQILSHQSSQAGAAVTDVGAPEPSVSGGSRTQALPNMSGPLPRVAAMPDPVIGGPDREDGASQQNFNAPSRSRIQTARDMPGPLAGAATQNLVVSELGEGGTASQQSFNLRPRFDQATAIGEELRRRVTVHSPYPGALTPVPPSVEQERVRRRANIEPPKPAIRRITRSSTSANLSQGFHDGDVSASPGFGGWILPQNSDSQDAEVKEETGDPAANDGAGPSAATEPHRPGTGTSIKIKLKNSKRPRHGGEVGLAESSIMSHPQELHNDPVEDDEDEVPRSKRARTQKPRTPAAPSRRGKRTPAAAKSQRSSGLAAPGVVHGSFPPGVVQGSRHPPPSSQPRP